jgi:tetratricopeptide (TPR) repeat protein
MIEGGGWLERALARPGEVARAVRIQALTAAGAIAGQQIDYARANDLLEQAVALSAEAGDPWLRTQVRFCLGTVYQWQGRHAESRALLEDVLGAARATGNVVYEAGALFFLGLGVAFQEHDLDRGRALLEEALRVHRRGGWGSGIAMTLGHLGEVALKQGRYDEAATHLRDSLALRRERGDRYGMAEQLNDLARVVAAQGDPDRSARLFAAAQAARGEFGTGVPGAYRADHDRFVDGLRAALGEAGFAAAWARGQATSLDDAVAEALATVGGGSSPHGSDR